MDEFIKKLEDLFLVKPEIRIQEVHTREEFDKYFGEPSKEWMVGTARPGFVVVFAKDTIEKVSKHKASKWDNLVKHEIVHLFIKEAFGNVPAWFNEGLATYLSGQQPSEMPGDPRILKTGKGFRDESNAYGKSLYLVKNFLRNLPDVNKH